jgi:hypothetical protein
MNSLINRVLRAALLDKEVFQEVEADPSLDQEALTVVIIVSVAGGIGAFLGNLLVGNILAAFLGLIINAAVGIANYYIWAYVSHYIGTKMFNGVADPGELLRVLGYASGPRILSLFGFIPCFGAVLAFVGGLWALVAGYFGVREALDLDTTETLVTVVLGWLVILFIYGVVAGVLGIGMMGLLGQESIFSGFR